MHDVNALGSRVALTVCRRMLGGIALAGVALTSGVGCRTHRGSQDSAPAGTASEAQASAARPAQSAGLPRPPGASVRSGVRLRDVAPAPTNDGAQYAEPESAAAPGCPDFARAVSRGRVAAARKDWAGAIAGFDAALRARPLDAAVRSERAYVYLLEGDPRRALADLARADSIAGGRSVMQQIWFNVGLAFDRLGQPEKSRLGFAVAAYYGSAAAKQRLGERSTCTALIDATTRAKGPFVARFEDLANERGATCALGEPPAGATPAQRARWQICQGCDGQDHCQDDPDPITRIPSGADHSQGDFLFARLPSGDYWFGTATSPFDATVTTEGGYVIATGKDGFPADLFGEAAGNLFHVVGGFADAPDAEVTGDGTWSDQDPASTDEAAPELPGAGAARCQPSLACTHVGCGDDEPPRANEIMAPVRKRLRAVVYTSSTHQQVLSVEPQAGAITLQAQPGTITVTGSGCNEKIPVPAR